MEKELFLQSITLEELAGSMQENELELCLNPHRWDHSKQTKA